MGIELITGELPFVEVDRANNIQDKEFSPPARTFWRVISIRLEIDTAVAAGTRQWALQFRTNNDSVFWEGDIGATVGGNEIVTRTAAVAPEADLVYPPIILPGRFNFRCFERNGISGNDDFDILFHYLERPKILDDADIRVEGNDVFRIPRL